jgi:hypothetical protein
VADDFAGAIVTGLARSDGGALFVSPSMAASAKLPSLSYREDGMPIDLSDMNWLSTVNWLYVAIMALFAFVAALLGGLISFRNRIGGALIAAILFAAMYVAWNYYPHPQIQLPIVTTYGYPPTGG